MSDKLFIVFKKKYREERDMKDNIITGNKPAPGSALLNIFFKMDGFKIKDIHPNKEKLVKIIVTIKNSNFSLNLIPIMNILRWIFSPQYY